MRSWSICFHWALAFVAIVLVVSLVATSEEAEAALDAVTLWNEDFSRETSVVRDGAVIGITATDLNSTGGTRNATVSDPTNPGDSINVTLYDDGTHGDATANDGIYTGNFTVSSDGGSSGSVTDEGAGVIDIAEGQPVSVFVDLDGDGSHSQVSLRTDYTGPGMATPFEGGYVGGELIITITIIVEGEAALDPGSVTYSIDAGPSVLFTQIAPNVFQAVIDTTLLSDGPHTVTTFSADEAGNVDRSTFDIIVDNTVPDISYGASTILPSGDVSTPVTVDDMHLDHSTIMWRWDGGEWVHPGTTGTPAMFDMVIAYDDMTPGNHSIEVTAKDLANNSMTYILRFNLPEQSYAGVTVEPPVVDVTSVEPGGTVPVDTTITNDGQVPADVRLELVVDGEVVDSVTLRVEGDSSSGVALEWPGASEGEHDVQLVVTMPNATTGEEPVDTISVTTPGGGPIVISVPKVFLGRPVTVVDDDLEAEGTLVVPGHVTNPGPSDAAVTVALVVDGDQVDFEQVTVPGGTAITVDLYWRDMKEGEHTIELRAYMPDDFGLVEPVDTVTVTDEDGGPVNVFEREGGDYIEGPLRFLNPLYERPPFDSVPEGWRPWFLPMLLVGILLGLMIFGMGRRRSKKDEPEVEDVDLKPVEMPPVTTGGVPPPAGGPRIPITTASTTGTADDEGEVPVVVVPPTVPPVAASTADDGKGEPCVEIIRTQERERKDVSDAQAAASDAKGKERDAQDEAESADRTANDAKARHRKAQKECDDAREEYEGHGVDEAEEEARRAKEKVKGMEDRIEELEGDKPEVDGVSWEPKPGYSHGGVGFGSMLSVSHVYYRDDQAEIDLNRVLKKRFEEYKRLKEELEEAKEDAEREQREAEEVAEKAEPAKRRMEEACEKARKAKEEAERARGAADGAQRAVVSAGADVKAAEEKVSAERAEADAGQGRADDCQDCLSKVRRALARIEDLRRRYQELRGGSGLKGPKGRHSKLDAKSTWDEYWDSFRTLRDHSKALSEIKGFTDADLPDEFNGIFDWGGPVGTAVGYGAEDLVGAPVPTDSIKAVGGLYTILQAKLDPDMKEGATALHSHLESKEADEAARAFKRFPRALSNGVKGFEKLYRLRDLDVEIGEALEGWEDCLGKLPDAPDTPGVDLDKLCYKQCLDKLKELEEAERRMRELVDRAEDCKPSGLEAKLNEANRLKGQLGNMADSMDRTSRGLANYRKAMKASSGCYISTAAYGTPLSSELDALRGFRDRVLLPRPSGRLLVDHYHRTAPEIAERLGDREMERDAVRGTLGLAVRLVHAREGRARLAGALLSLATVGVYVLGSLQAWLLTRR